MTRLADLPLRVRHRLVGPARRRVLARELLQRLPANGEPMTIHELSALTGFDRVDVANALRLLLELRLVTREGTKVGQWALTRARK
jgi:DNA-binding IclR family transcriptional regulator